MDSFKNRFIEIFFGVLFFFGILFWTLFFYNILKTENFEKKAVIISITEKEETDFWGDGWITETRYYATVVTADSDTITNLHISKDKYNIGDSVILKFDKFDGYSIYLLNQ